MRNKRMVLATLAAFSIPALAAKPTTVEELRQMLAAAQSAHQSDDATASQLGEVRLTARLTGFGLQHLLAVSPGPKTTESLNAIAGTSTFLDPPPGELPAIPAPDFPTQRAIVAKTVDYAIHTLPSLPNFLATRTTAQFVDDLRGLSVESVRRGGLFFIGDAHSPIAFRDGIETDDPTSSARLTAAEKKAHAKDENGASSQNAVRGLSSWGEFGPILSVVLLDAAKGKLGWARWEQEEGKPVAVFRFSVDRSLSHYTLSYCCETSMTAIADSSSERVSWKPGYHGLFEIDPDTGTILRITIETDLRQDDPIHHASMMVEYGPVKIGESVHTCPTRSVSISESRVEFTSHGNLEATERLQMNVVKFIDYRRFGSESTILTELPPTTGNEGQPAPSPAAAETASAVAPPQPSTPAAPAEPALAAATVPPPSPTPSLAAADGDKEILIQSTNALPALGDSAKRANAGPGNDTGASFTLKVTTRSVDVGLVASDKRGKPIADLKQDEVQLFDNGRLQQLVAFHHLVPGAAAPAEPSAPLPQAPPDTFANTASPASQSRDDSDLLILLLDESHLAFLDLNRSRGEMLRFLGARPTSRIALYSMSEQGFHVIQDVTQDHAQAVSRLKAWTPHVQAVSQSQAQPSAERNNMQVTTMADALDTSDLQGNSTGAPVAVLSNNLPLRYALQGLMALARHFASVPGRKSIAWISGDAALASWSGLKGNPELETAIRQTQEALNEARIVLYAIDASATNLGPGGFDASTVNPNGDVPAIQNGPLGPRLAPSAAPVQQEALGIQGPARQLAESTGGRAINKGGDLKDVLEGIGRESDSYYELAFDPDTPADGKFHTLTVKAPSRKNVVLRYRTGYMYAEDSANTQQRFQQAVWSPQDATAIGLTAEVVPAEAVPVADSAPGSSTLKLRIGFPGLALTQKDGRWTDQLYIFVAQRDDATQKAEVSGDTLRLSLKQATYDSGMPAGIPYQRNVEVKSKLGSVRVIVVDGNSGRMGSVTLPSLALHP